MSNADRTTPPEGSGIDLIPGEVPLTPPVAMPSGDDFVDAPRLDMEETPPDMRVPRPAPARRRPPAPSNQVEPPVPPAAPAFAAGSAKPTATPPPAATLDAAQPNAPLPQIDEGPGLFSAQNLRGVTSGLVSLFFNTILLILMALVVDDHTKEEPTIIDSVASFEKRDEAELAIELEESVRPATETSEKPALGTEAVIGTDTPASSIGGIGLEGGGLGGGGEGTTLDRRVVEAGSGEGPPTSEGGEIGLIGVGRVKLATSVPQGTLGDARVIVSGYGEALDKITQEILYLLEKQKVLVVWVFDESESMKDDQKEIRQRVEKVYRELGLNPLAGDGRLMSAVMSYGENFHIHTRQPVSSLAQLRTAIDGVPVDPSGKEMMCQAVGRSIALHREFAAKTQRQMVMVLVTDESGEPADNNTNLEAMVAEAKGAKCRVYCLGREAVFGYPFAFINWIHPQTGGHHWLQIDRGPETPLVEQLQIDGFRRRHDAFPSGYGPYEQARLCRETGGVFFMLPSLETNLVSGEKRKYELEAMRPYLPDLRSRMEYFEARERRKLPSVVAKVINDTNPYDPNISKIVEMRVHFSPDVKQFVQQVRIEQAKATIYLDYLARMTKVIESLKADREKELSPRWQANYDLIRGQLYAYQARIYEYGAYLEFFIQNPKVVPLELPPNIRLVHWDVSVRQQTMTGPISKPYIEKAADIFRALIAEHAGTPWAARAQYELTRGFGVELVPNYQAPLRPVSGPIIPVPKF